MRDPLPPKPPDPKTTIGCAVTVPECQRLHALARAQGLTVSALLRTALTQTYGTPEPRGED